MNIQKVLRYTGLALGFLASAFFTLFLIAEGGADLLEGKIRVIPIMLMMIMSVSGFIWAVAKPAKGSLIMIAGGVIMSVYLLLLGGFGEIKMALIYGLPFIIPGVIFYYISTKQPVPDIKSIL
jgi:hypothetical protein